MVLHFTKLLIVYKFYKQVIFHWALPFSLQKSPQPSFQFGSFHICAVIGKSFFVLTETGKWGPRYVFGARNSFRNAVSISACSAVKLKFISVTQKNVPFLWKQEKPLHKPGSYNCKNILSWYRREHVFIPQACIMESLNTDYLIQ